MKGYVMFALRHPELFHLMFGRRIPDKRKHAELMEASTASFQFLSTSIAEFMADASDSPRPPRFSALAVWSGMHGLATLLSDRDSGLFQVPDPMIDQVCDSVTTVLLTGLQAVQAGAAEPAKAARGRKAAAPQ
jgi:hypothetical protein